MKKRIWLIGIGVITLTLIYIWSNSFPSVEQSNRQSGKILRLIEIIFNTPPLDTLENQHVIRKIAHVAEYGLLGFEMALLLLITGIMRWQNMMNIMFIGLAAATMDETIQIFAQRGSLVSDVVLDFGGVLIGIGAGFMGHTLVLGIKKHMQRKKQPESAVTYASNQGEE